MQERLRRALPDLLIALVLLALPLLLLAPQTLGGRTLLPVENLFQWQPYRALAAELGVGQPRNMLYSDLILENYVWKLFAREQLLQGQLPQWQPYILGGSPFLAAGQSSALYPFFLLFLILPVHAAYGWFALSQLWIAGLAMFTFARVLGLHRPAALIAAITYQLSGFFLVSTVFTMIVATAAWLPLLLASIELVIRQGRLRGQPTSLPWAVLGALVLGVAALAGHLEALYMTLLVMAFYAAARLIAEWAATRRERGSLRRVLLRGLWLVALVAVGLALGAVQIIPAAELAGRSARIGGNTLAEILSFAYPPRHVAAFLMPNFFGSPAHQRIFDVFQWAWVPVTQNSAGQAIRSTEWGIKNYVEGGAYLGLLALLLALLALVDWGAARLGRSTGRPRLRGSESPTRPTRLIFALLALISILIAFGTPLYALLYYALPYLDQARAIFRWVWPLTLSVGVLAGFGAEALLSEETRGPARRLAGWLGWITLAGGAVTLLGLAASRLFYDRIAGLVARVFERLALAPNAFASPELFYSYEAANALQMAVFLLLAGLVLRMAAAGWRLRGRLLWPPLAALVLAADLLLPLRGFLPASDPSLLDVLPASTAWLKDRAAGGEPFRVMAYEDPGADTFNANMGWIHGLQDAVGYDSLIPGQYAGYMNVLAPQSDLPYNRIAPVYSAYSTALDSPLFDLLNVRYVITETTIPNTRFRLAYEDEAVRIYENPGAVPRAFTLPYDSTITYNTRTRSGWPTFEQAILAYDVRANVLLPEDSPPLVEREFANLPSGTPGTLSPAAVTAYQPGDMWIDVDAEQESWLVVSESYYPGWRAFIRPLGGTEADERLFPARLVDGNFIGVYLPPGQWTVHLDFGPDSLRYGAFTSFMAAMLIIFAGAVWAWRRAYRETSDAQRVAKNTLAPIVLNLFNKGIMFVLTFVMYRVLGAAGAGEWRYAFVVWGWFEILANFGLNTFLMREVARHKDDANRYLVNTTVLRLALALLGIPVLAAFLLIRQAALDPALSAQVLWAVGLLYGGLFFSTISTGLTALFYAYEKAEYPAAIQTISAFLNTTLGVLALLLGWGIVGLAGVSVLVNLVTLLILGGLALRLFFRPRLVLDWPLQRGALSESFPLMLNHLLATLFFRIDVVLLEALKGATVVGWYGVVYTWIDTIGIIPAFFTTALFPMMSRQAHEDRPALKRTYLLALKVMSVIIVPTAAISTLLASFLINVLAGPQYLPHGAISLQVFIWAMVFGWLNSVTQYVIIALDRQRALTAAFAIVSAFNIGANLIAIPRFSYVGSAAVTILSEAVLLALFYRVIHRELGRIPWLQTLGKVWLAGALMAAAGWALAGVSIWLAAGAALVVFAGTILVLRPFTLEELARVAPMLPGRLRNVLLPRSAQA